MGKYDDLEIIKKLKDDGDMTEEEFETEKKIILSRQDDDSIRGMGTYAVCAILGICSLLFSIMGIVYGASLYVSIILGVVAIVLGILAKKKLKANNEKSKLVTSGIIAGTLGTIISMIIIGMVVYSVIRIYKTDVPTTNTTTTNTTTTTTITPTTVTAPSDVE